MWEGWALVLPDTERVRDGIPVKLTASCWYINHIANRAVACVGGKVGHEFFLFPNAFVIKSIDDTLFFFFFFFITVELRVE